MSNEIQRPKPAWHAEAAEAIAKDFHETAAITEEGKKRRARLGLFCIWVKENGKADGSIPHGQWGDWLKHNLPEIPASTIGDYMTEANSICERLGWQISEIRKFEHPPHRLMLAEPATLKPADRTRQLELFDIIEQRTKFRAITQYKQVEMVDGETVPRIGRLPGEGGKRALTVSEKIAREQAEAVRALDLLCFTVKTMTPAMGSVEDRRLDLVENYLRTWIAIKKWWVAMPQAERDLAALAQRLKSEFGRMTT